MLMMRPLPSRAMNGRNAWMTRSIPIVLRFTSSTQSLSGHVLWRSIRRIGPPALLTTLCTVGSSPFTAMAAGLTESERMISVEIVVTRTPDRRISSAACSSWSLPRASSTRSTPSAASALAIALPIPLLPPVITATLPRSPSSICPQIKSPLCPLCVPFVSFVPSARPIGHSCNLGYRGVGNSHPDLGLPVALDRGLRRAPPFFTPDQPELGAQLTVFGIDQRQRHQRTFVVGVAGIRRDPDCFTVFQ